jgi:hypothetical protein
MRIAHLLPVCLLILFVVAVAVDIKPVHAAAFEYTIYGQFTEDGSFNDSIDVTLYQNDDSLEEQTIDNDEGDPYSWNEDTQQIAFKFDLGNNETRTYYLTNASSETIYIFTPDEPYYQYFFEVIDYVGVTNGFLETLINKDGTERVVERWSIDVQNQLPFTCTFGSAYKMRIVCDEGTYYLEDFVAGATTETRISITSEMFPASSSSLEGISVLAQRMNSTWIQAYYGDSDGETANVTMSIWEYGESTVLSTTGVQALDELTWNIYGAGEDIGYYVQILVNHDVRGELEWVYPVGYTQTLTNPFTLLDDIIESDFPIPASNLIGMGICLLFFGAFSTKSLPMGVLLSVLVAMILTFIGAISINWTWLATTMGIAVIIAFSIWKERSSSGVTYA